jgi:chemotaxis signal transduction protein
MSAIYLLNCNGHRNVVRKEEVATVRKVETVHRLPFSPEYIVGLAIIDKRRTALADLAGLIGQPPFAGKYPARILFGAGQGEESGFIFAGDLTEIEIDEASFHRMPPYLATPVIESCIDYRGEPIPVIGLMALYRLINAKKLKPSRPTFPLPELKPTGAEPKSIKLFNAGGEVFALPGEMVGRVFDKAPPIARLPSTPPFIKGVTFIEDSLCPVVDPAEKINLPPRLDQHQKMLKIDLAEDHFGFLVDDYRGELPESRFILQHLPPLAQSPLIKTIAICDGEIIPLLNPSAILNPDPDPHEYRVSAHQDYLYNSAFPRHFNRQDVAVVEFILLGEQHALPKEEVADILPIRPFRKLPALQSLVIGIILHQGGIVPILDPALVFGRVSPITEDWQMILVKNGDFQAFIVSQSTFQDRNLPLNLHKKVPLSQTDSLVYGCYPDDNRVRLIINAAALATRFDKKDVKSFLSSHTSGITETAPVAGAVTGFEEQTFLWNSTVKSQGEAFSLVAGIPDQTTEGKQVDCEIPDPDDVGREPSSISEIEQEIPARDELADTAAEIKNPPVLSLNEEITDQAVEPPLPLCPDNPVPSPGEAEHSEALPLPGSHGPDYHGPETAATPGESFLTGRLADKLKQQDENHPRRDKIARIIFEDEPASIPEAPIKGSAPVSAEPEQTANSPEMAEPRTEEEIFIIEPEAPEAQRDLPETDGELMAKMREIMARQKPKEPPPESVKEKTPQKVIEAGKSFPLERQQEAASRPYPKGDAWREFEKNLLVEPPEIPPMDQSLEQSTCEAREDHHEQPALPPSRPPVIEQPRRSSWTRPLVLLCLLLLIVINVFIITRFPGQEEIKPLTKSTEPTPPVNSDPAEEKPVKAQTTGTPPAKADRALPLLPRQPEPLAEWPKEHPPALTIIVPDDMPLTARVYTVKEGDTLWDISRRFTGTPYNYPSVAHENDIANPDLIYPEQPILLKRGRKP